jgi:hypothetical protein
MADHDETKAPGMFPHIDDDDVEGHSMPPARRRALEPDGMNRIDEDDVNGHHGGGRAHADGGPDDLSRTRVQSPRKRALEPDGVNRIDGDDVEGHYGSLKGPSTRGE